MRLSISPHPCGGDDGGVDAAVPPVLLLVAALPLELLLLLMLPLCDVDSIVLGMVASNQINSIIESTSRITARTQKRSDRET